MATWVTAIPANRNRNTGGGGLRTITTRDIRYIKAIQMGPNNNLENGWNETRPVFVILFRDNSKLVVKGEYNAIRGGGGVDSVKWGGKLMRQVSPQLKTAVLAEDEVQALRNAPASLYARGTQSYQYLSMLLGSGVFVFFKMPFIDGLSSLDEISKGAEETQQLFDVLSRPGIMRSLGKIIAVDLFIGNSDRFCPEKGVLMNASNLIFQKLGDGSQNVIGLDFYESGGFFSNLRETPEPDWGGFHLRNPYSMEVYATKVVAGLNAEFAKEGVGADHDFTQGHAWQIRIGMQEGVEALQAFINRRLMAKRVMPGVLNRARLLGWF